MNQILYLLLLAGFGFSTLSVRADPVSPSTSPPVNKGRGIQKDVPVGDFDAPQIRDLRQQSLNMTGRMLKRSGKPIGKIMHSPSNDTPIKSPAVGDSKPIDTQLIPADRLKMPELTIPKKFSPNEYAPITVPAVGDFGSPDGTKALPEALKDKKPVGDPGEIPSPDQ